MPFKMNNLGIAVEDSPQLEALREALVNMLMHTDYFSHAKPRVRIFTDRLEFENPGNFPLPISELLMKDISLPRNPVIAKLFRNVKLAETAGYGFSKMLKWEQVTQKKVNFENSIDFSFVTFILPVTTKNEPPDNYPTTTRQVTEQVNKMLLLLNGNENISAAEIMNILCLKHRPTFIYTYLQPAIEQGYIELLYPGSSNHPQQKYRLTKKGIEQKNRRLKE